MAPDPEAKARALFACYHGTLAQARIQNDLGLLRDFKQSAMDVLGVETHPSCFPHDLFLRNFIDDQSNTTERSQPHAN